MKLDLSSNSIQKIPSELYQLVNLTVLCLADNLIDFMDPTHVTNLKILTELDLSNNLLTRLPFGLSKLPLKNLNVTGNLLLSPYCFPLENLTKKDIIGEYIGKIASLANPLTPFTRLFFLGTHESRTFTFYMIHPVIY